VSTAALPVPARAAAAAAEAPALPRSDWARFAIAFAAYLIVARLGIVLAVQPGNASPLFPAAGVGLAMAFVWGRPALAAVLLAAWAANLWSAAAEGTLGLTSASMWLLAGAGSALQCALGVALLRRFVALPLSLSEPADVARFMLLVVPLACLCGATVAVLTLLGAGTIDSTLLPATWAVWWIGDMLGMLIGAPIVWTLIGAPRDVWAARRWSLCLPLLAATALIAWGLLESAHADRERLDRAFQREAAGAAAALQSRLLGPLHALEAMRGLAEVAPALERDQFRRAALRWIADAPAIAALGLQERIGHAEIGALEARERAGGAPGFRVVQRGDASRAAPDDDMLLVIRMIEPFAANASAQGIDSRSTALARPAIDQAVRSGNAAASAAFTLSQGGLGVVVYQALYRGEPGTEDERVRALRGAVFATLRPDALLRALAERLPPWLTLCLLDADPQAPQPLLAGTASCAGNAPAAASRQTTPIAFAGRQWQLRAQAAATALRPDGGRTLLLGLVSLASAGLLGALLLTITGRARRIAAAVAERTAELQQRSAELQAEASQRQRTASALRDSQQRLRNILDHAPIGVAYTDTDGRIREANPHLRELLGLTVERLSGMPIADLLHPDDRAAEAQARAKLLAGELPMAHWHLRCLAAGGQVIYTRASVSVLRNQSRDGQARRMVWVIEDITEHLALEEAQRARKGAEAANRAKSEFLSRMSHELRTPLNAMLGFAQLLELDRKQPLAPHQLAWTAQMRHAGWHLLHMINDTLDLSRIESGHIDLEPRALDLGELVEQARTLLAGQAAERRVSIDVHLGSGARAVIGDATRVKQILTNLISNAVKYNVEGGQVIVTSRRSEAGRVAVDVIDAGPGMGPEQLEQLFQPFNRLGREHGPIEGTGIGLVISLRLAELMGGALSAKSQPGLGSTFTLELPRAASEPAVTQGDESEGLVEPAGYRRRLVIYVEDNETNAEVMRGILALRPQVQLQVCPLGLDGLAAIRAQRPSLVLLDMQLPDVDGLELLRHLQGDEDTSEIPVIVVSADATESRIAEAVAAGATHYLTKPVNVAQFLAVLDALLEQLDTHFG
jgi:PAS domain S-box-containing protein